MAFRKRLKILRTKFWNAAAARIIKSLPLNLFFTEKLKFQSRANAPDAAIKTGFFTEISAGFLPANVLCAVLGLKQRIRLTLQNKSFAKTAIRKRCLDYFSPSAWNEVSGRKFCFAKFLWSG